MYMSKCLVIIASQGAGGAGKEGAKHSPQFPWAYPPAAVPHVTIFNKNVPDVEKGIYWRTVFDFYTAIKDHEKCDYAETFIILERGCLGKRDARYIRDRVQEIAEMERVSEIDIYAVGKSMGGYHLMQAFEKIEKYIQKGKIRKPVSVPYAVVIEADNTPFPDWSPDRIIPKIVKRVDVFLQDHVDANQFIKGTPLARTRKSKMGKWEGIRHFCFHEEKRFPPKENFPPMDQVDGLDRALESFSEIELDHWTIDEYMTLFGWINRSETTEIENAKSSSALLAEAFMTSDVPVLVDAMSSSELEDYR